MKIPVLCCCNPSNQIGLAPDDLPLQKREWEDLEGNTGLAYSSEDNNVIWSLVPGFEKTHSNKPKTWRKTWKNK